MTRLSDCLHVPGVGRRGRASGNPACAQRFQACAQSSRACAQGSRPCAQAGKCGASTVEVGTPTGLVGRPTISVGPRTKNPCAQGVQACDWSREGRVSGSGGLARGLFGRNAGQSGWKAGLAALRARVFRWQSALFRSRASPGPLRARLRACDRRGCGRLRRRATRVRFSVEGAKAAGRLRCPRLRCPPRPGTATGSVSRRVNAAGRPAWR